MNLSFIDESTTTKLNKLKNNAKAQEFLTSELKNFKKLPENPCRWEIINDNF